MTFIVLHLLINYLLSAVNPIVAEQIYNSTSYQNYIIDTKEIYSSVQ